MKRNIINEIRSVKLRAEFTTQHDFIDQLDSIEEAFENILGNKNFDEELLKYIPIATVACFEAFFRSTIKELIDFGKPYSDNVIRFNQARNIKFDFDIVNAIQAKSVTVGEFVSHILPCNNFEDINSNLSIIINCDFLTSIKAFQKVSLYDHINENSRRFLADFDQILADIKRTFELRHIFCHEFAINLKISKEEILRCFKNSRVFLNQTNEFMLNLIYPNMPETQAEINTFANVEFQKVDIELDVLILKIKSSLVQDSPASVNLFDETIIEWKKYREARAKLKSSEVEGGSIYLSIYVGTLEAVTREKIISLKNEFRYLLRED